MPSPTCPIPITVIRSEWFQPVAGAQGQALIPSSIAAGGTATLDGAIKVLIRPNDTPPLPGITFVEHDTLSIKAEMPWLSRTLPHFEYSYPVDIQYPAGVGSEQGSRILSKNPFWRRDWSSSLIRFRKPFRKDVSSSSVPQPPSSAKSRVPLPPREDSYSSVFSRQQSSRLAEFFEERALYNAPYTNWDFQEISRHLRNEQQTWSTAPRLYTVLRTIGELHTINKILDKGYDDYWFSFEEQSVPNNLGPYSRQRFLATQVLVLTKAVNLEKSGMKEHVHFGSGDTFPFEVKGTLGSGGFATVDKVCSAFSHREFARKRFRRGKGESQKEINDFKKELQVLKRIEHHHCVELVSNQILSVIVHLSNVGIGLQLH